MQLMIFMIAVVLVFRRVDFDFGLACSPDLVQRRWVRYTFVSMEPSVDVGRKYIGLRDVAAMVAG